LPAIVPGVVRSASGKLEADLAAAGPLAKLIPHGKVTLAGGAVSVAEYGDWSDLGLEASFTGDVFRVEKLTARSEAGGRGTVDLNLEAKGLARQRAPADLRGALHAKNLTIPRAGQELATVDLDATVIGTASGEALEAVLTIPQARVKLPDRSPRRLQSLERRGDIVVGSFDRKKKPSPTGSSASRPYRARVRLLVPNRFFVTSGKPVVDV
jgi:translocation and assembly module TamB